jgi:hypothetical protein
MDPAAKALGFLGYRRGAMAPESGDTEPEPDGTEPEPDGTEPEPDDTEPEPAWAAAAGACTVRPGPLLQQR